MITVCVVSSLHIHVFLSRLSTHSEVEVKAGHSWTGVNPIRSHLEADGDMSKQFGAYAMPEKSTSAEFGHKSRAAWK